MAKKKTNKKKSNTNRSAATARPAPLPAKKKGGLGATTWIAAACCLVAVVAIVAIIVSGGSKGPTATAAPVTAASAAAPAAAGPAPADEQKYIGRLLPAKYTEQSVAPAAAYSSAVKMTDVTATQDKKRLTLSLADVTSDKIVYFEYRKVGSDAIPMVAYVKPSGKLFVGVSYCVPCKGKRQRIESDGTLTCEACGTKRDLETGVGIGGSCRLYPLDEIPATISGGKIVVQTAALEQWTAQPIDRPVGS